MSEMKPVIQTCVALFLFSGIASGAVLQKTDPEILSRATGIAIPFVEWTIILQKRHINKASGINASSVVRFFVLMLFQLQLIFSLSCAQTLAEKQPTSGNAIACYGRGMAKGAQGDYTGAIDDFNKAIELKPDFADAYFKRGYTRAMQGNRSGAIDDYDKAIELKPDIAGAYYCRGLEEAIQGNHTKAIDDFNKAIELKPDFSSAYYHRGIVKVLQGNGSGAIDDLYKAKELRGKINKRK